MAGRSHWANCWIAASEYIPSRGAAPVIGSETLHSRMGSQQTGGIRVPSSMSKVKWQDRPAFACFVCGMERHRQVLGPPERGRDLRLGVPRRRGGGGGERVNEEQSGHGARLGGHR